jgi:uncharacterized protein YfiM (DUF2279 family)
MKNLLLLLLFPGLAFGQVAEDKKMHFAVSAVAGVAAGIQWPDNKPLAFSVAMIPGVAKELLDAQKGGSGFDTKDLAADALGAITGVYLGGFMVQLNRRSVTLAYSATF